MKKKFRFHILGLSHAQTTKEYSCEAFTQKVRVICKMLTELGHTVYHYGTAGSNPVCTENIEVLSKETFDSVHRTYDWKKDGFITSHDNPANIEFTRRAIEEITKRRQPTDFLLCSFGLQHKPIADAVQPLITTELGIGYRWTFAPHRIFESYGWMHFIYGAEGKDLNPPLYDAVIPAYYDLNDFIYSEDKEDYFFFIARPTPLKGLEIAIKTVETLGSKLIVAGQGTPPFTSPNMEHIGAIGIEERAKWMSKAKATFVPTIYIEPFGSTVIESLLCGTPVITTDFGAFPETVLHGKVGYRCRSLEQFIWAARNIDKIKPKNCRKWAEQNYSLKRVGKMYEEYFDMLYKLYSSSEGWYNKTTDRTELNWLNKKFI
jgi:glycosyltransferase involved in cell wall biosynthesis